MSKKDKKKKGFYAGVDLGGTSFVAVVTDHKGNILGTKEDKTQVKKGDPNPIIGQLVQAITKAAKKADIKVKDLEAIGIGPAGAVNTQTGVVHFAPNLGWEEVPLADRIKGELGVQTYIDNDVHVAIRGEHGLGAAEGATHAAAIWVGTGVGGGLVINGELYTGGRGSAGEIGHTIVQIDGPQCKCGNKGCVEALSSRTSMERMVNEEIKKGRQSIVPKIMEEGNKPRMTSSVIAKALAANDEVMVDVFSRAQFALGILTANIVNTMDPEVVVIGGGIAERMGEDFVGPIREHAYKMFLQKAHKEKVKIVPTKLKGNAGAVGAALLARHMANGHR